MNTDWKIITEHYNNAVEALWCPEKASNWRRDEITGYYNMWNAYYLAMNADTKDELTYARILMMVADSRCFTDSPYEKYTRFYQPALEAYNKAKENGQQPTEKEYDKCVRYTSESKYEMECEQAPFEEQIKQISGYELLDNFGVFDGRPILFEHGLDTAKIKIDYYGKIATFLFEDVYEITFRTFDPTTDWISEFCCYRDFYIKDRLIFDIGSHRIVCTKISVESIEKEQ